MSERLQETETPKETPETEFSEKPLTQTGRAAMQGFSENAPLNKNDASDWVDHGVIDVPVADLPEPEGVESPADFDHHISWEDAQTATKQLPEIQKGLGEGKTGDDFSAEDQAAGKDYANGKRRVYDLFYGSDPVRLNKDGNTYDIVGGRHRIFAAKELGLESIPARVIEKIK